MRELIARVMSLLLAGAHPTLATLRAQFGSSRIRSIEYTGPGFFAEFEVPEEVSRVEPASFTGGDVFMRVAGLREGAGCVLFINEGRLDMLEGFTYGDEQWPAEPILEEVEAVRPVIASTSVA